MDNCKKQFMAEMVGTMTLVLFGCGTAVVAGAQVGVLGIAFAFGLALIAMAYGIGPISGCHINPAVSFGMFMAGRMSAKDMIGYILAQCIGAVVGAFLITLIVKGQMVGYDVAVKGLGQNGFGVGYLGEYSMQSALIFEFIATFLFVKVILGATGANSHASTAGLAIGLALVVIHIFGIQITGVSVNPARSLGPAIFVGAKALEQLWVFIAAPMLGGGLAGLMNKMCCDAECSTKKA